MKKQSLWFGVALLALAAAACSSTEAGTPAIVSLTVRAQSIVVGDTIKMTANVLDGDNKPVTGTTLSWSSSKPDVASVDGNGLVKGVGAGTTTIKASAGSASGTLGVIVTAVPTAGGD